MFRVMHDTAASGQNPGDGNIFVDLTPVQTGAADLHRVALSPTCLQQPGTPGHAECKAVVQFDPHGMLSKRTLDAEMVIRD